MELILVRHALPERSDGDNASADPTLSGVGVRQAEATAAFLADEPIHAVYASPLRRACQTAQPLADILGVPVQIAEGLREIDPFSGSYVPAEDIPVDHPVVEQFVEDRYSLFAGEGGFDRFRTTVVAAMDTIITERKGARVAVFCHGTVIGAYLTALLGHDDPFVLLADYCGIFRVTASSSGLRTLRSANETGHVRDSAAVDDYSA